MLSDITDVDRFDGIIARQRTCVYLAVKCEMGVVKGPYGEGSNVTVRC